MRTMTERTSELGSGDQHREASQQGSTGRTDVTRDRETQPTGDDGAGESAGGQVSAPGEKADTGDADMADNVGATGVGEPKPPHR